MTSAPVQLSAEEQELKRAFRALWKSFGGQEAAAAATGYAQSRFSDWSSPNCRDFPPLQVIAHLEECTVGHPGHPHVTRLLARMSGFALVDLDEAGAGPCLMTGLARITQELGELNGAVLALGAEGAGPNRDAVEAAVREASDVIDRAVALRAGLVGRMEGGRI